MIYSLKINDFKKIPYGYLGKLKYFSRHKKIEFKPGINLIIGPNGSGKSTLLKLIQFYFGELDNRVPSAPEWFHLNQYDTKLGEDKPKFYEGVDIVASYDTPVFSLHDTNHSKDDSSFFDIETIVNKMDSNHKSEGEKRKFIFNRFFGICYEQLEETKPGKRFDKRYQNPKELFGKRLANSNHLWADVLAKQNEWYDKNNRKDDIPTFILDEPEANMDMSSCIDLGKMFAELSANKKVQYLMVLHDPYMIKKIKDTNNANIIELYPGYIDTIDEYFRER